MSNSQPTRFLLLRHSLLRPILSFGGDRTLTICLWVIVIATCLIARFNLKIIVSALALGGSGQFVLQRLAKADPQWFQVYRRALPYETFYRGA